LIVALYEAVFGIMESLVPEYQMQGFVRERSGASMPGIAPTNTYCCRDGLYVAIAGNGDGFFVALCMRLVVPTWHKTLFRRATTGGRHRHSDSMT
jgi:formyl-CoA transferase